MPSGAPGLHQVLVGLPLQTNVGTQFCHPIPAAEQVATAQYHPNQELWVGGSPFHKDNRR